MPGRSIWKRYGFAWVTLAFFLFSLLGHWVFGWFAFVSEQAQHGQPPEMQEFLILMGRDIFENWQSEFLQLLWQVGGLAYLLYLGSPQSKEGDDRMEAKIDEILRRLAPEEGKKIIDDLDEAYAGRHTDQQYQQRRGEAS